MDEQEVHSILYHGTYGSYLSSILEKGLVPGSRPANFRDSRDDRVYLTSDPSMAAFFAETAETPPAHEDVLVLSIDMSGIGHADLEPDESVPEAEDIFQHKGAIEASRISILTLPPFDGISTR